jgi:23S rRNA A2030 N6-methylase RlmJ
MIKEEIEKMYKKENSTQELWDYFKKELEDSIDENIPQKTAKIKDGNPWITRDIKRLIRKRDRLYKKNKRNQEIPSIKRNTKN